jgi:hypothetical protein
VVECLHSRHKALSLNPSISKKQNRTKNPSELMKFRTNSDNNNKIENRLGWAQWLTPVIPANQEAEIGRIEI